MPFPPAGVRARLSVRLTRLGDAAARLDRAAQPRVLDPLTRMDCRVLARLLTVLLLTWRVLRTAADRAAEAVADWLLPPSATTSPARRVRRRLQAGSREVALASGLVLLAGLAALGVEPHGDAPAVAVRAAAEAEDRPGAWTVPGLTPGTAPLEPRPVPDLAQPAPAASSAAPAAPAPVQAPVAEPPPARPATPRWLPTGTGMWLHDWSQTEGGDARAVVEKALGRGLTHLYVQTGSTRKGWLGDGVLPQLLPATAGTDLKVIAWDFPKLVDPEADARRLATAAWYTIEGAPHVAAVAPDVETAAEGADADPDKVALYYRTLRKELPPETAILATVPWPSEKRTTRYPYDETAVYSDAFVPMAYWYNRDPGLVTFTSMHWLSQFGLPVMPVGQGYDGRIDAPYLPEDPDPARSVRAFLDTARAGGARSVSLWSWQTMSPMTWQALIDAGPLAWPPAS